MSQITKKAISEAFVNLLKKKPFNKITIGALSEECGISRMTFYYHFEDIYDMLDWIITDKMQKAVEADLTYENWRQGLINVFNMMLSEKDFFIKVFSYVDLRKVEYYLTGIAHNLIMPIVCQLSSNVQISEESKNLISKVYEFSLVGLFLGWISGGMEDAPEGIVMSFAKAFRGSLKTAIYNSADNEE